MIKKIQLKNGLQVLLIESHKSPVISTQMWVRTGSADEGRGEEGLSHFIEHLVFKGSDKFKSGEIASIVEGSGGELNAYTSLDQTVFYITISKHFIDTAFDALSEMMIRPSFDKEETDKEREVVIEEIRQGKDSLSRVSNQKMLGLVFKKHPYGRPVIGYEKVVRSVSMNKIKQYFQSRYSAKNMFLVVAGDFKIKEIKTKVQEYFGHLGATKPRRIQRRVEPKQVRSRVQVEHTDFLQSIGSLAWRIPNITHRDVPALDVLTTLLGGGDSSRLISRLRVQNPLVNSISAYAYTPQDPGLMAISFSFEIKNINNIFEALKEEIINIINEPPSVIEMQKALTSLASERIYSLETVDGLARSIGSCEFYYKDPDYFSKYIKDLYSLSPTIIFKVAYKYFNPDAMSVSLLVNQKDNHFEKTCKGFIKAFKKSYNDSSRLSVSKNKLIKYEKLKSPQLTQKKSFEAEKIVFPSGLTLLFKREVETPSISARAAFLGGVRAESKGQSGLAELFSRCFTSGSAQYTEEQINWEIDRMASGLSAFSGKNSCGLSMEFLSNYTREMFDIFGDILKSPKFDNHVLEREKVILKNQIKTQKDKPGSICSKQFSQTIFGDHPYAKDMLGEESDIEKLDGSQLKTYYKNLCHLKNLTISVVGDIEKEKLITILQKMTENYSPGARFGEKFILTPLTQDQRVFHEIKKEQTHIMLGYRGLTLSDPDRFVVHLINSILAGQGGRLFLELRDKNSLAYSVFPTHMEGIEGGYFGGYISCAPEKAKKSIEMLKIEFMKLADQKISEEELKRAKRYIIGGHDIDLQRKSHIANSMLFDDIYGNDFRTNFNADEIYSSVSVDDIQRVSQKIFSSHCVISAVGGSCPW